MLVSVYMFILGAGVGMVMQNLVLIVQNTVSPDEHRHLERIACPSSAVSVELSAFR